MASTFDRSIISDGGQCAIGVLINQILIMVEEELLFVKNGKITIRFTIGVRELLKKENQLIVLTMTGLIHLKIASGLLNQSSV
mgnify:CR=1 FL=1